MKKLLFGAVLLSSAALFSCKKDYTCSCQNSVNGTNAGDPVVKTINDTKKKAEEECDKGDAESTTFGITTKTECSIKE